MLQSLIRSCFVLSLIAVFPVFADEPLSTFNQHGDINYQAPLSEEEYLAEKAPVQPRPSGYFGVDFGPNITSLSTNVTVNSATGGSQSKSTKKSTISYGIGAFGGYGTNFNHLYLGTEMSVYCNFLKKDLINTGNAYNVTVNVQQPLTVGFDFIPGYLTTSRNVLLYGRLGFGLSWMKLRLTDTAIANLDVNGKPPSDKVSKFVFGLRAGAGIEYFICDNFSLRTEYTYVGYNKVSGDDKATNANTYSYKLGGTGSHQVKLGLLVHF